MTGQESVEGQLVEPADVLAQRQAEYDDAVTRHRQAAEAATLARSQYAVWRFEEATTPGLAATYHARWAYAARWETLTAASADAALDAYVRALQLAAGAPCVSP